MPSNTQFTEIRVEESEYVSLGKRNETNRSILTIARGKTLKEALKKGREDIQPSFVASAPTPKRGKQLQGKIKFKVMMREAFKQHNKMKHLRAHTIQKRKAINDTLTNCNQQIKKEQINKKVLSFIAIANDNLPPNQYHTRVVQTHTLFIAGKIQYYNIKKIRNIQQIRSELVARGFQDKFNEQNNWTELLKI